ncbi:MAG: ABC transporter ATP-binding protein [Verrucomicrobiaceae bacterium]|nr:ABC transporter ATP-binding protein [Verrucomicrobiaceae bacterium]
MPTDSTGITVSGLKFEYPNESFAIRVDSLVVMPGEAVAIVGPSGCGKSTLLRVMAGLLSPHAGRVQMGAHDVHSLSARALREFRLRSVGLVFQDFALLDYLTVEENVLLPVRLGGFDSESSVARAHELIGQLGIAVHTRRLTREISQGERQRVAIARALAHQPRFVFADEPTASLDAVRRDIVGSLLLDYARRESAPLILVTHDPALQQRFDRVVDFTELSA